MSHTWEERQRHMTHTPLSVPKKHVFKIPEAETKNIFGNLKVSIYVFIFDAKLILHKKYKIDVSDNLKRGILCEALNLWGPVAIVSPCLRPCVLKSH